MRATLAEAAELVTAKLNEALPNMYFSDVRLAWVDGTATFTLTAVLRPSVRSIDTGDIPS